MGPDRKDFPNQAKYNEANKAFVAKLIGIKPDTTDPLASVVETLEAQFEAITLLTERVVELDKMLMRTDTVFIEDRGTFEISTPDHLKIALAAIMASRGIAVDLPLFSGEVIENVRIGELTKIASELFVSEEFEGGDDEPAAG